MNDKRRFRLASVLRVARLREKQAERSIAERVRDELRAETDLRSRTDAYEARPQSDDFHGTRTVGELRARAVRDADEAREVAVEQLAAARDAWLQAARHRRSIEELEERHYAAHAMVAARAAQRALDDLVKVRRKG